MGYDHGGVGEQLAAIFPEGLVQLDDLQRIIERIRTWQRTPPHVPAQQPFTLERMLTATLEVYEEAAAMRAARRAESA